jgi:mono/diheme cytochrome c family protein
MKKFLLGVLVGIAVPVVGAFSYLRLGMAEVRADIPPGRWENYLMNTGVHASVRRSAPEAPNPVLPTDENLIAGGKFYLNACAGCHGTPGKPFGGKGPILYPPIPELSVIGTELSEAQIFWVAKHGIRRSGMFANGAWASEEKLWTVAAYVKHMNSLPPAVQVAVEKLAAAQP